MRTFGIAILFSSFLAMSVAIAQDTQKMIAHEEVIELLLLRQKSVQEDLKIDAEKSKKIREFCHKQHEAAEEVHKLPEAEQKGKWQKNDEGK